MKAWLAEATGALLMVVLVTGPIVGGTLWVMAFAGFVSPWLMIPCGIWAAVGAVAISG